MGNSPTVNGLLPTFDDSLHFVTISAAGGCLMRKLADWIGLKFSIPAKPPSDEGFTSRLPHADVGVDADENEHFLDEGDLQGQSFQIEYHDSAGEISHRRITVRKLERTADGYLCLKAFCWERQAARAFRVDRILACRRLSDAAPIKNAAEFFGQYIHDGIDTSATILMNQVRPGLRVLLYLARCDGNVHPAERDVMRKYVMAHSSGQINWAPVETFIDSQHPDRQLARSMLKAAFAERARAARLLTAAKQLVDADGRVAPEEVDTLEKMLNFSDALRYKEDIRHA